eukprot:1937038-Prymnesium_polylepis.2
MCIRDRGVTRRARNGQHATRESPRLSLGERPTPLNEPYEPCQLRQPSEGTSPSFSSHDG